MVMVLRSILTMLSTNGKSKKSPGPLGPSEAEDHTPLVLLDDLDGAVQDRAHYQDEHHGGDEPESDAERLQECEAYKILLLSGYLDTEIDSIIGVSGPRHEKGGPRWASL